MAVRSSNIVAARGTRASFLHPSERPHTQAQVD